MSSEPRPYGQTLGEAAMNKDGTWNGIEAARWMYWAQTGRELSEDAVQKMLADARAKWEAKRARSDP